MVGLTIPKKVRIRDRKPVIVLSSSLSAAASAPAGMADSQKHHQLASGDSPDTHPVPDITQHEIQTTQLHSSSPAFEEPADQFATIYHCIFYVLPCGYAFDNIEDWKAHVLDHFKGHTLPVDVRCAWCGMKFFLPSNSLTSSSGSNDDSTIVEDELLSLEPTGAVDSINDGVTGVAPAVTTPPPSTSQTSPNTASLPIWHSMLNHIAFVHINPSPNGDDNGRDPFPSNNYSLMQYLYWSKSITEDQFKAAVQLVPAAAPTTNIATSSPSSDDSPLSPPMSPLGPAYRHLPRRYSSRQQDNLLRASVGSSDEPFVVGYSPRRERRMREQQQHQLLLHQQQHQIQDQSEGE